MYLLKELRRELGIIDNKVRFILGVINEEVVVKRQKRKVLVKLLYDMKFTPYSQFSKDDSDEQKMQEKILMVHSEEGNEENKSEAAAAEEEKDERGLPVPAKEYDYLLSLPLWSLTYEKVEELLAKKREKEGEITALEKLTPVDIWSNDLNDFIKTLDDVEKAEEALLAKELENAAPVAEKKKGKKGKGKKDGENAGAAKKTKKKGGKQEKGEEETKEALKQDADFLNKFMTKPQLLQPDQKEQQLPQPSIESQEGRKQKQKGKRKKKHEEDLDQENQKVMTDFVPKADNERDIVPLGSDIEAEN